MRVDVLGSVWVSHETQRVGGRALGGRRARIALVALALSRHPLTADRLAAMIWGEDVPLTWPAALRGVVGGLRSACELAGVGRQDVIATVPVGYQLAADVEVDVEVGGDILRRATELHAAGRHRAALELVEPVAALAGSSLLAGEDADWIAPHRRAVDALAAEALQLIVAASTAIGDHATAIAAARRAVLGEPLDERAHRGLIRALDRSGDRSGVVRAFEDCRSALAEHLGVDPSAETVELYLASLSDQPARGGARLPAITSSYFGRTAEIAELDGAITQPGLVTVTGLGGIGKSRLALQVATSRHDFAGGRSWVSLSAVAQDALVAVSVAFELGVITGAEDPTSTLARQLTPLGRLLLVLDGCEAVLDGVASLVTELRATCPQLTVLVTSRAPLAIEDERVIRLQPLRAPELSDDLTGARANVAVRLLLDRVREGGGELVADDQLLPYVITLVQRCGGLPLAMELAAAQLTAMPVGDLLDHLGLLGKDTDDRLRSMARSSYELLDPDEATVFRTFGALDGTVGLPLVKQVVSAGPIEQARVVRILRELAARGLVTVDRSGARWRYHQDDDVHRFAGELLAEAGEERSVFSRLAEVIRALLPDDARASPGPFSEAVSGVRGPLRSLFAAALDGRADLDQGLEISFRLHRYFAATNIAEGRYWLGRLSTHRTTSPWLKYACYALGYLSYWAGDTGAAMRQLSEAVELFAHVPDAYVARASIFLAGLYDDLDRGADAVEAVRNAMVAAAPFDVDLQVAAAMGMGSVLAERGNPDAARHADDAVALCRAQGTPDYLALVLPTAAMVCWQVGAFDRCRNYLAEALPLHSGERRIARVVLLSAAAGNALADGQIVEAVNFGRRADLEATALGVEREVPLIRAVLACCLLATGDLAGAADRALAALDAAKTLTFVFPHAICLETAALVAAALHRDNGRRTAQISDLLASAERIRARGDRPALPALAGDLGALRAAVGAGDPLDPTAAAALARRLLSS